MDLSSRWRPLHPGEARLPTGEQLARQGALGFQCGRRDSLRGAAVLNPMYRQLAGGCAGVSLIAGTTVFSTWMSGDGWKVWRSAC